MMTMMFEVADLSQASPATVSRCGMVYFSPAQIGWKPLVLSWLERSCARVPFDGKLYLLSLFDSILPIIIGFCNAEITPVLPYVDASLVAQLLRNLDAIAGRLIADQSFWSSSLDIVQQQLQSVFVMSLVWSFGVMASDEKGRREFDTFLRALFLHRLDDYISPSGQVYKLENFPAPPLPSEESETNMGFPKSTTAGVNAEKSRLSTEMTPGALNQEKSTPGLKSEKSMGEKLSAGLASRTNTRTPFSRSGTVMNRASTMRLRGGMSMRYA